ncbi:hypothetical protein [Pandoraea sp. PE-S2R-1]|uniref:hypothetical protein n=1 Tax=Pandoraea sp. PE-S2R-1 TaxID=1986994 RepID=UPI0011302191|nr:hypothetical protein [Pandoraea sp. PE-S2R-1]
MKREILESMDKGVWYTYGRLAGLVDAEASAVSRTCRALVADRVIESEIIDRKVRVRLLMSRCAAEPVRYDNVPTVAAPRTAPAFAPLVSYEMYANSHKALCEVTR